MKTGKRTKPILDIGDQRRTLKSLISELKEAIKYCRQDMDEKSFGYEKGVLLTGNEAKVILEHLRSIYTASKPSRKRALITDSEGYEIFGLAGARSKRQALEILDRHARWWEDHHIEIQASIDALKRDYE